MNKFVLNYKLLGNSALLIEWPNKIDQDILEEIVFLQAKIEIDLNEFIIETINAYNSLTVIFEEENISLSSLIEKVKKLHGLRINQTKRNVKIWNIPVCYDEEFGIDLQEIADQKKCSVSKIVDMHTSPKYMIYFTGFLPGFLYLGGLPSTLVIPRKATPRLQIIKGAVAIGGQQTGIYPSDSPGGWNIIGNSPLEFFNPTQNPPCFAKSGDYLKFFAIDKAQHLKMKEAVDTGVYEIECSIQ